MKSGRIKALLVALTAWLVSYTPAMGQLTIICDNPNAACGADSGSAISIVGDPTLVAPTALALVALGIVAAILIARRK